MSDLQRKRKLARKGMILSAACGFLLAAAAGCGKTEEEGLQIEAIGEERDASEDDAAENGEDASGDDAAENGGNTSEDNAEENVGAADGEKKAAGQSVGNVEVEGSVTSLSADNFVINKIETWSEGDFKYAVDAAPGYEKEENQITVHVAESCAYEYKTVKNGGVNPEDISAREGAFTDLKEGLTVIIKGSWQEDGSFLADQIEMEEFV